jgi:alkanesulfonate monooxygenase SsuD/methylene tetrahydromethanopterin reductase-like flavin-dependent oxidoreductase (luciferase family)
MCDRAGVDSIWVHDHVPAGDASRLDTLTALTLAAGETSRLRVGAIVDPARRPLAQLIASAAGIDLTSAGRLDLGFTGRDPAGAADLPIAAIRAALEPRSPQPGGPSIGVEVLGPAYTALAIASSDDVILPLSPRDRMASILADVRAACADAARDPSTLGVAAVIPVSIGRTSAEARGRAHADPGFGVLGDPGAGAIVGSLEECQRHVLALAHAGVTDLRCILPAAPDVEDVIAQLTAMVVGSTARLAAGAPPSSAPPPPRGWGGRSRAP